MPGTPQIIPATIDELGEILVLEQLGYSDPWAEHLLRAFLVASSLPSNAHLARVLRQDGTVVGYALASRQDGQLLVERLNIRPEDRRKGFASGLMVSLIYAARELNVAAITCTLGEENLTGQLFLKCGGFKALPTTNEARREKVIQFARTTKG